MRSLVSIASEYPFQPASFDLGPAIMRYIDVGPRLGPTVVLLHGNPTWSFYWRHVIRALEGRYRVIAPDHVGCGLSDKPQEYDYRLTTHIDNLARLLAGLGPERVHLVMHDWGGAIGCGWAAQHPERVASLTVCNTAAFRVGRLPLRLAACRLPLLGPWLVQGLNAFLGLAVDWGLATSRPGGLTASERRGYALPYPDAASRIAILRFVQDIPMSPAHPSYARLAQVEAGLERLRDKPLLALWGLRDFVFDERFLTTWLSRFPTAQVQAFPRAGHLVIEDARAECIKRLAEFLATVS